MEEKLKDQGEEQEPIEQEAQQEDDETLPQQMEFSDNSADARYLDNAEAIFGGPSAPDQPTGDMPLLEDDDATEKGGDVWDNDDDPAS